jgi:hypothetical protein
VLKMTMQTNQASWLLRALLHMPIAFQTASQSAARIRSGMMTISQPWRWFGSKFMGGGSAKRGARQAPIAADQAPPAGLPHPFALKPGAPILQS